MSSHSEGGSGFRGAMPHLDEYRDPAACRALVERIAARASRRHTLMEVCGGQTHGLLAHGIDRELADVVELIHGPGCPVCVTPEQDIDWAIAACLAPGVLVATFGDMLRVPGRGGSLREARAAGGQVRMVYSPLDAVSMARERPDLQVVFLAVGFETTAPATALAVRQAREMQLDNFSLLVSHVRVLPAMEMIAGDPGNRVDAFLAAGHVCAVDGYRDYHRFARDHHVPVVVTGFEPVDLLLGILECVEQLEASRAEVVNVYHRNVREAGNDHARQLVDSVYEVADRGWRGIGEVPGGGLQLRAAWRDFDARLRLDWIQGDEEGQRAPCSGCRSGEVLVGRIKPPECPSYGGECTPEHPLGAPMVSSEGACMAYYLRRDGLPREDA